MKTPAVISPSVVAGRIRCFTTSQSALPLPSQIASTKKMFVCVCSSACVSGLAWSEVGSQPSQTPKTSCAISPRKNGGVA
jgi:hypothetical protein